MKFLIFIATIITFAAGCGIATTKDNSTQSTPDSDSVQNVLSDTINTNQSTAIVEDTSYINDILRYRDSLDEKLSTLKKVKMDIEGSAEGGEAILYLAHKDTLKMDFTFYGETGKSNHVFYLQHGIPVFYLSKTIMYAEPIAVGKDAKVDSTSTDEIVLQDNKIADWKLNEGKAGKETYGKKEQDISELFNEVRSLLIQ